MAESKQDPASRGSCKRKIKMTSCAKRVCAVRLCREHGLVGRQDAVIGRRRSSDGGALELDIELKNKELRRGIDERNSRGQSGLEASPSLQNNQMNRSPFIEESNSSPVYAGWDETLRQFVVTNKFAFK